MFTPGQKLTTPGLDKNCRPTVETVVFVRYLEPSEVKRYPKPNGGETVLDCVVRSQRANVLATLATMQAK